MKRFVAVEDAYQGFYAHFRPQDKQGMDCLAGAEGIVGTELQLSISGEDLEFIAHDERRIARLDEKLSARLKALMEQGWVLHCVMACTFYCAEDKSFSGEFACICYRSQLDTETREALATFTENIADRIAGGTRPSLALTQEQFVRVVKSGGTWFLTKEEPWPELPKGSAVYRRRRTFNDRLVSAALKGNKGCLIASWLGIAIVIAAILWAIWTFFL
jgi:hypothetical protein